VTLSFVDERQFLTMILPVLPLHECADHAPTEFAAEPLHSIVDPATVESPVEHLHSTTDSTSSYAAMTEKFCLCVRV
jgi:hypothetical protein